MDKEELDRLQGQFIARVHAGDALSAYHEYKWFEVALELFYRLRYFEHLNLRNLMPKHAVERDGRALYGEGGFLLTYYADTPEEQKKADESILRVATSMQSEKWLVIKKRADKNDHTFAFLAERLIDMNGGPRSKYIRPRKLPKRIKWERKP